MKQYKCFLGYYLLSLCLLLVACDDDKNSLASTGYLYLGVEEDNSTLTKSVKPVTDESLRVYLLSSSGDTVKTYDDYLEDVKGEKILLPVGNYQVLVSSSQTAGAAWEAPFYAGKTEEPLEIKSGEITNATVTCKITNTKVTVSYSEKLKATFIDYCDTVNTESGTLIYARDEYRAGYFVSEGDLTARLYLKNKDGNEFTLQRVIRNIKPQYHYNLIYQLSNEGDGDEEAGADFDISVSDEDPTEINCTISIKEEELAGEPKIALNNFDANKSFTFVSVNEDGAAMPLPEENLIPTISWEVPAGIASYDVKVTSDYNRFTSNDIILDSNLTSGIFSIKALLEKAQTWNDLKSSESYTFKLTILDKQQQEVEESFNIVVKPNLPIETLDANEFATFAFLKAATSNSEGVKFKIWKESEGESSAKEINATLMPNGYWGAIVTGLTADTKYVYKAVAKEVEGNLKEFTTMGISVVANMDFEQPWQGENAGGGLKPAGDWDSGNTSLGGNITNEETSFLATESSKRAIYMKSKYAVITFAAGNIYTGTFIKTITSLSNPGAELDFGIPYFDRPTALNGYYCYRPQLVNRGSHAGMSGKMDQCSIYIALCDWTAAFRVNTQKSQFVDFNADYILGYGELTDVEASRENMEAYEKFSIPILYRDITRKPTYILIVASASKYGDYFTGGEGSELYIDEFSFGFDYRQENFVNTEYSGLTPVSIKDNQ